ncbi:MAG: PilZ domain-containing protein [Phycisphaerae bacterium]
MSQTQSERRRAQRYSVGTRVQFYHNPTRRDFPGRSVDISSSGMLMYVPATVPVHPGQKVDVSVGTGSKPEFAELSTKRIQGTIVRVDRNPLLAIGNIAVGVQFVSDQDNTD